MEVGHIIVPISDFNPVIQFVYHADSNIADLLNNELIIVRLKGQTNNRITYFSFNISITINKMSISSRAVYDRGRHYNGIGVSTENPLQADGTFTVQFLTTYNPALMGHHDTRRIILESNTIFPAKTKFTLIDKTEPQTPKYYYYINTNPQNSIELTNFIEMGTANGERFQIPTYNEVKEENLIIVVDYSMTDKSAVSSEIYLRHTINSSEKDMLEEIPKVHSFIGEDSPSISLGSTSLEIGSRENLQLDLSVTASKINTIYLDQKYSAVFYTNIPLPYGTKVKMNDEYYNITDSNKRILLPIENEGLYEVIIQPPETGFLESFIITACLYSAPDSKYPFTTSEPIAEDIISIAIAKEDFAIRAEIDDSQRLVKSGGFTPLNFTITAISDINSNVNVRLFKKESNKGFNYTELSSLIVFPVSPGAGRNWTYTPDNPWEEGIYRFVFELLDDRGNKVKSTPLNIICYE